MSKGKKRSREKEEDIGKIMKKLRKLTEKVEKLQEKGDENIPKNNQARDNDKETNDKGKDDKGKDDKGKDDKEKDGKDPDLQDHETEDEDLIDLLGDDPSKSQAMEMKINPEILKRWTFFCREGVSKEDLEKINKKYACAPELDAPKLNPQISSTMKEVAITRDNHMVEIQTLAGKALSMLGSMMTNIYDNKEESFLEDLVVYQNDIGRLLSAIIHKQSNSRKAFIEPGLSKDTKTLLKSTKIGEFLYGNNLAEKIKEAKALDKMGENLKIQPVTKPNKTLPGKPNLNYKTPFARRPTNQTGYTYSGGRQKQPVYFKNRQQFINHNSKWVKKCLCRSGIDVTIFQGHSTRHAATSTAQEKGVDFDTIRRTAGWSERSQIFAKFYKRPIIRDNHEFARAVLNTSNK